MSATPLSTCKVFHIGEADPHLDSGTGLRRSPPHTAEKRGQMFRGNFSAIGGKCDKCGLVAATAYKEFHHGPDTRRATAECGIVYPTSVLSAAKIGDLLLRPRSPNTTFTTTDRRKQCSASSDPSLSPPRCRPPCGSTNKKNAYASHASGKIEL